MLSELWSGEGGRVITEAGWGCVALCPRPSAVKAGSVAFQSWSGEASLGRPHLEEEVSRHSSDREESSWHRAGARLTPPREKGAGLRAGSPAHHRNLGTILKTEH